MIPYGRQDITESDIAQVVEVLKSDFLTQGPAVPKFEDAVAHYCDVKFAVAVNSATSALHIDCLALGLGPNDHLWTSPISFVASANCGLYCGARVDFVDIDPHTYNMSIEALEQKLINAKIEGRLPKIVVPVHLSGQSCDMQRIHELSQQFGFHIIEDASHAIGGRYLDQPVGSCKFSDITVFSFHPVKIITTGEGGMSLTNNEGLASKMRLLRSHGITRDPAQMKESSHGSWYYQQIELGFNYRMTDIQAALGFSQLGRIDQYVSRRNDLARRYDELLEDLPVFTPYQANFSYSAFHLYPIRLNFDLVKKTHVEVFESLRLQGVGVNLHYIPIHMQPYYQGLGFAKGDFPEAERYYSSAISLPLYPALSLNEQDEVVSVLSRALV